MNYPTTLYQGAAFVPHTMTKEQIINLRRIAFRKFYGRPSFIIRKLLEMRTPHDFVVAFKSAKSLLWLLSGKEKIYIMLQVALGTAKSLPMRVRKVNL